MGREQISQYFMDAGMPDYLVQFAAQFLEAETPTSQAVVIPRGGGRGLLVTRVAQYTAEKGGRALIVTDGAVIREHLASELTWHNVSVVNLDRRAFRSLQSRTTEGTALWHEGAVIVTTAQLAAAEDIKSHILSTEWDFVAVCGVQALGLIDNLYAASVFKRLLITTTNWSKEMAEKTAQLNVAKATTLEITRPPGLDIQIVEYNRSTGEVGLLNEVQRFVDRVSEVDLLNGVQEPARHANAFPPDSEILLRDLILQGAESSTFALEMMLERRKQQIRAAQSFAAHYSPDDKAESSIWIEISKQIDDLLNQIDDLGTDSKFECLVQLLEERPVQHVLLYARFRDTADYLQQVLSLRGIRVFRFSGSIAHEDLSTSWEEFFSSGGIAIFSISPTGIDIRRLKLAVILYDVPTNYEELLFLASRVGLAGGMIYGFRDKSGVLKEVSERNTSLLSKLKPGPTGSQF